MGVWSKAKVKCERLPQVVHCRNCDVFSRAGREVLERKPPAGYVTQWQQTISRQEERGEAVLSGVMVFRLGMELFAVPAQAMQEVAEIRSIHRVPHNDNQNVAGIVNIGGEINICYSLSNTLGIEKQNEPDDFYERLLVVNSYGEKYIFPVCEVIGITRYAEGDIVPIPTTLGESKSQYIDRMFVLDKSHVALLNIEHLCQTLNRTSV